MTIKGEHILLILVLIIVVGLKLFLVNSVGHPNYDSYYTLRQIETIKSTGTPLHEDELSYEGRTHIGSGAYYELMAILSIIIPTTSLIKYSSVFFFLISLILVYLISKKLFPARWIAFLTTTIFAFTTSLFTYGLNTANPSSLFFVLYLTLIYVFFTKKLSKASFGFIILFALSVFTSSKSLILALGSMIYFLLLRLEFIPLKKREFEVFFFSGLFAIWYYSLLFKSFFSKGISTFWNSIPKEILSQYFAGLTIPLALSFIGIIPMLLGFYALYRVLFNERNRKLVFLVSLTFAWGLVTWAGFIQFREGLVFGTINLVLLSGYTLNRFATYFKKTKIMFFRQLLAIGILLLVLIAFIPTMSYDKVLKEESPTQDELNSMNFLASIGNMMRLCCRPLKTAI